MVAGQPVLDRGLLRGLIGPAENEPAGERRTGAGDANTAMDGYIFDVIRNGILNPGNATVPYKMPPYAHAINERDAWSIVAYIRVLQQSELVKVDDPSIPENERARLRDTIQALRRQGAANPASTQPSPAATPGASEKK